MKIRLFVVAVLSASASLSTHAAQQGTLGATSTGSFTLTADGPAAPRLVQVLNLSDLTFNNSTRADSFAGAPGATMRFCLVDTYGGAVQLQLSNSNGFSNPNGWKLLSSGGDQVAYTVSVTNANDGSLLGGLPPASTSFFANAPSGVAVTNSTACGVGNIKFNAVLENPTLLPETVPARSYTDTITIVATPV